MLRIHTSEHCFILCCHKILASWISITWSDPSMNWILLVAQGSSQVLPCHVHAFLHCDTVASTSVFKTMPPCLIFLVSNLTNLLYKCDLFVFTSFLCNCMAYLILWLTDNLSSKDLGILLPVRYHLFCHCAYIMVYDNVKLRLLKQFDYLFR